MLCLGWLADSQDNAVRFRASILFDGHGLVYTVQRTRWNALSRELALCQAALRNQILRHPGPHVQS